MQYNVQCCLLYVGETGDQLNVKLNGHGWDIKCNPYRCELPRYFNDQGYDFNEDLKVSVLEKVSRSQKLRVYKEDKRIIRLGKLQSTDMNSSVSEFGKI